MKFGDCLLKLQVPCRGLVEIIPTGSHNKMRPQQPIDYERTFYALSRANDASSTLSMHGARPPADDDAASCQCLQVLREGVTLGLQSAQHSIRTLTYILEDIPGLGALIRLGAAEHGEPPHSNMLFALVHLPLLVAIVARPAVCTQTRK
jgi:hypothetical protein